MKIVHFFSKFSLLSILTLSEVFAQYEVPKMSFWERIKPPVDISSNGHLIDWLFNYITAMDLFYFVLVCLGLFGFAFLYHYRRHPKPYYTYGNKKSHLYVTMIIGAAVFLSIDMNITRVSNNDLLKEFWNYPKKGEDVLRVEILAQQWMWNIRYAGKDGLFNTADDVVSNHDLKIPVGKKVEVRLTSKDVIHSFFLPNVRRKVDAIPGRITRMWFDTTQVGTYPIVCAEMCGISHYLMKGQMTVLDEASFNRWMNEAQNIANVSNDKENPDQFWGWNWE